MEERYREDCPGCVADRLTDADRAHLEAHGWTRPGHTCRGSGAAMLPGPQVPIPYGVPHVGPRRTLTLVLRKGWFGAAAVHVNVDGSSYVLPWGSASFDVPADRPVTVAVYQHAGGVSGLATTVLAPGPPIALEYRASGTLGVPGATRPLRLGTVVPKDVLAFAAALAAQLVVLLAVLLVLAAVLG